MVRSFVFLCFWILMLGTAFAQQVRAENAATLAVLPKAADVALDTPFGQATLDQIARAFITEADAACLQKARIGIGEMRKLAMDLITLHYPRMRSLILATLDDPEYSIEFDRLANKAGAYGEWVSMFDDPLIVRRWKLMSALSLDFVTDRIVEKINQSVVLDQVGKRTPMLGLMASGDASLMRVFEKESAALDARLAEFDRQNPNSKSSMFAEYTDNWSAVFAEVSKKDGPSDHLKRIARMGPREFVPGIQDQLRSLCLFKRTP